ncbi:MAG: hypothetical protein HYV53_03455 [Parcubacteria group bacterium]|nr:hypothetical protein [Parcubacteria group bacterium]
MLQKISHFIKYNNAAIIILAIVLILGGGALAAGPENIGQKQTIVQGLDNTALLAVDLENFNMDFKIENLEQDEKYYYVTYSFLDLVIIDNAWQYQLNSKTQKVSQKIKQDLGEYMAKFMAKHYEARRRELTQEKKQAQAQGAEKRFEVIAYSGLIGRTLDLAAKVFPGYEPLVKKELPSPENFDLPEANSGAAAAIGAADNLTEVYNDYLAAHPDLLNSLTADASSTPAVIASSSPDLTGSPPADTVADGIPTAPAMTEPASAQVIELPTPAPAPEAAPAE